ncbi:lyase [Oceanicola sp. 22II-s10i]|uniref:VOC family protein n=1 Tax=Oceanicola sp. 22II-s10i TaxID=1317116 RepID=UPI000B524834|nr:VOC family protein [Oceanicola sp. 22II-s10i]OWU83628.1 lyase [Oceanicola sp. 22II-s10i]
MIDHVSIAVSDLEAGAAFWSAVLAPLGYKLLVERDKTVGFGKAYPEFWLNHRPGMAPVAADTGVHICMRARDEAAVRAFHEAAVSGGGASDGAPGPRQAAMTGYFGAFIKDPDGNKAEAICFPAK